MHRALPLVRSTRRSLACLARSLSAGLALVVLSFALGACQGSLESRLDDARALQDAGQFRESIDALNEILQTAPDHADAN